MIAGQRTVGAAHPALGAALLLAAQQGRFAARASASGTHPEAALQRQTVAVGPQVAETAVPTDVRAPTSPAAYTASALAGAPGTSLRRLALLADPGTALIPNAPEAALVLCTRHPRSMTLEELAMATVGFHRRRRGEKTPAATSSCPGRS